MPLPIATVIFFTQPIMAPFIAFAVNKETIAKIDVISIFSAMFGVVILIKPELLLGSAY